MIALLDQPFDAADALRDFEQLCSGAGAIVSFTGRVRDHSPNGTVQMLHLQAYSPLTEQAMTKAAQQARERWDLGALAILHRVGDMQPDDTIVFVAAASAHRRDAFEAADFLMDYLKTKAVFWKKETTENGSQWIEPRAQDYEDSARWNKFEKANA